MARTFAPTLVAALASVYSFPVPLLRKAAAPAATGHHPGPRGRRERRGAARRLGDGDEPVDDRHPDPGDQRERLVPVSRGAARGLHADVRAGRLQHGQARRHPGLARLHGQRQRRHGGGHAAGNRDRHRPVAGDRHLGDARAAELQAGTARIDSERPRHVGAAGRDAGRGHEPRRRRRQSRRHADRLHRVRLERPGAHVGGRHQHHGRHRRCGLLLRLRIVRRSLPGRGRSRCGSRDAGRAVELPRQVGRQSVRRRVLRRRLQQLVPGLEPVGDLHAHARAGRLRLPRRQQ